MYFFKLLFFYFFAFVLATVFALMFPSASSSFVDFFFSGEFQLPIGFHIRYRMSLFIVGSLIFFSLVLYLPKSGFFSTQEIANVRKAHWWKFIIMIPIYYVLYRYFPTLALCSNCWTKSDVFYFLLALNFFLGFQFVAYGILLKIKSVFL